MASYILVLNCGSSSIKFALINPASKETEVTGIAEKLNLPGARLKFAQHGEKITRIYLQLIIVLLCNMCCRNCPSVTY